MTYLYALVVPDVDEVKIGYTMYPRQRIQALRRQYGATAKFIALSPGTRNDERIAHEGLRNFEVRREWFSAGALPVRKTIAQIRQATDDQFMCGVNTKIRNYHRAISLMEAREWSILITCRALLQQRT